MPSITLFSLPERHDDAVWLEYQALVRAYDHEIVDGPGFDMTAEAAWADARLHTDMRMERFLAYEDGAAVGYATLRINLIDDPTSGDVSIYVLPAHRGRGIGRALAGAIGELVGPAGLERLEAWVMARPGAGRTLVPASGIGSVPADDPGIRFAVASGFKLEQVERVSRYDFSAPLVDPHVALAEAMGHAGDDYELIVFEGVAPDDVLPDLAILRGRMSTDAPVGGMTVAPQVWDAARLAQRDERLLATSFFWRAVAVHRPTHQIVALSEIARIRTNPEAFLDQWDTIVLPEHRGHRLGMLVKAANLIQVREAAPDAGAIMTWNAEENRYMLNVNEALGFRQVLVEAAFQRSVATLSGESEA